MRKIIPASLVCILLLQPFAWPQATKIPVSKHGPSVAVGSQGVVVSGRPSIFYLVHVLWRHRHTQAVMTPPVAIQRIVFPMVLLVGGILGKYRGTSWPGCPDSCIDAPLVEAATA